MSEDNFVVKDSGARAQFDSGMYRDTSEGKVRYNRVLHGPMFKRWAAQLHRGAVKYPDLPDGMPNWMLANGLTEYRRFQESLLGHCIDYLLGDRSEDHAAAMIFNVNGAEYVRDRMIARGEEPPKTVQELAAGLDTLRELADEIAADEVEPLILRFEDAADRSRLLASLNSEIAAFKAGQSPAPPVPMEHYMPAPQPVTLWQHVQAWWQARRRASLVARLID